MVEPVWEAWQNLDIAVVGIGRLPAFVEQSDVASYVVSYQREYLENEELVANAVSDVCLHHFDAAGHPMARDYESRSVSIMWEQLQRAPLKVGIAGGKNKVLGIVGAARSRLVNTLVTDEETANNCLKITEAGPGARRNS